MIKKNERIGKVFGYIGVTALAICSVAGLTGTYEVSAKEKKATKSTAYVQLFEGVEAGKASKAETVGDYTFCYDGKKVMVSSKSEKEYEETSINKDSAFTNGKTLYFTKGMKVYKLNLKTKKFKKVATVKKTKKSKKSAPDNIGINKIINNRMYLTRYSWGAYRNDIFSLNIKTSEVKEETTGEFAAIKGKYAVIKKEFSTDVSACEYDLVKFTNKGLKNIKKLCDNGMYCGEVGGKYYFMEYKNDELSAGDLYRCNKTGKTVEFLGTIKGNNGEDVVVFSVKKTQCTVSVGGTEKTFNYKTKSFK